jgi:hypothetical protein
MLAPLIPQCVTALDERFILHSIVERNDRDPIGHGQPASGEFNRALCRQAAPHATKLLTAHY